MVMSTPHSDSSPRRSVLFPTWRWSACSESNSRSYVVPGTGERVLTPGLHIYFPNFATLKLSCIVEGSVYLWDYGTTGFKRERRNTCSRSQRIDDRKRYLDIRLHTGELTGYQRSKAQRPRSWFSSTQIALRRTDKVARKIPPGPQSRGPTRTLIE